MALRVGTHLAMCNIEARGMAMRAVAACDMAVRDTNMRDMEVCNVAMREMAVRKDTSLPHCTRPKRPPSHSFAALHTAQTTTIP